MTLFLYSLSILLMMLLPVALAILLRRRYAAPWGLFCLGMVTFIGSQIVHIPLNKWLADIGLLAQSPSLTGRALAQSALILGLTAGLGEEVARAVGYWFLFRRGRRAGSNREDTFVGGYWADAVMSGLGHGGIEAMAFGGVLTAATLTSLLALRGVDLSSLNLSADQMAALQWQMKLFTGSSAAFLPFVERVIAMVLHVAFSLMVWTAFKRRQPGYVLLAVLTHAMFDGVLVYALQYIENAWLLEGLLALMAVPLAWWLWYSWQRSEQRPPRRVANVSSEWTLFGTAVGKEMRQQWQTRRVLVVVAVFLLFGLGSPLLARFTPELLRNIEGAEQFAELVPTPTAVDALTQYIKNITQFGFIMAILLGMGAVAGEKERGTAAIILSKPMARWAFVLSKFVAQALVYLLAFLLAALAAYYYTLILFKPLDLFAFLLGNFLLLVWLLVFAAVTLLGSAIANSTSAAAGMALFGCVLLLLAGGLPVVGALAPAGLVGWASQLGVDTAGAANGGALAASVVLIMILLITAVAVFERQEL
jgi:ABC-2 type transport system permease protein